MSEKGIIKGFTVVPDFSKLGEPITAFILMSFLPNNKMSQRELALKIAALDGVHEVHLISGEHDILMKVRGSPWRASVRSSSTRYGRWMEWARRLPAPASQR